MIVRIRTNLGVTRLEVDAAISIAELRRLIAQNLNIEGAPEALALSEDLAGTKTYAISTATLCELGVRQGSEIFVVGKFEKRVVDKAFVGEDGVIVPAGQTLIRIDEPVEEPAVFVTKDSVSIEGKSVVAESTTGSEHTPHPQTQPSALPPSSAAASTTTAPALPHTTPEPAADHPITEDPQLNAADYEAMLQYEEDGLRAPDEVQRINLLGGSSSGSYDINHTEAGRTLMHAVLLPEVFDHLYWL